MSSQTAELDTWSRAKRTGATALLAVIGCGLLALSVFLYFNPPFGERLLFGEGGLIFGIGFYVILSFLLACGVLYAAYLRTDFSGPSR